MSGELFRLITIKALGIVWRDSKNIKNSSKLPEDALRAFLDEEDNGASQSVGIP